MFNLSLPTLSLIPLAGSDIEPDSYEANRTPIYNDSTISRQEFSVALLLLFQKHNLTYDILSDTLKLFNPSHPKFPADRQAVSGRKNRVRLRSTPLPLRSLPGMQARWGGRWMNSRRDGAANDIHKWPHPPKSWDKAYTWPVSLYHTD